METFWDTRYDTDTFVYGKEPNRFFVSEIEELTPGRILFPGEGEGRNAVYASKKGWNVDAFDQSRVAAKKANTFASEVGTDINYKVCGLEDFVFKKDHYDAVVLIFFHTHPALRKYLHNQAVSSLKPGGKLILEAFHTSQLGNATGGPQSLEMLFDAPTLKKDFSTLTHQVQEEVQEPLDEGPFHQGKANLIRYTGFK